MNDAPGLKTEGLIEEIKEKVKIAPVKMVKMKTRNPEHASYSYFIYFKYNANINGVRNIAGLSNNDGTIL